MILYLIIAPTLLKPEVWHELIRIMLKVNGLSDFKKDKDVDIKLKAKDVYDDQQLGENKLSLSGAI